MLTDAINEVPYIAEPVEVGRGGFATVYRARDLQADRPVAVKLLSLRSDDGSLKYFDRERESLARLSTHPNVVTLHRTGVTTSGVPYLVMEYATGGSLSERLKADGPLVWTDAVEWILPIGGAIEHAHEQGVRHRDIKPQNILISAHGEPLLSDFGISGLAAGTETLTQRTRLSLSYASPEQVDGREVDDSTDVYSLGATLYTLIAGAPAFADTEGAGLLNTAKRIIEQKPPPLDDAVPVDIRNAIAAAMAKNPANRPTIDQFCQALKRTAPLDSPPPGDELPAITREFEHQDPPAADAILAARVDDWSPTLPGLDADHNDDEDGVAVALSKPSRRSLSLVAIGLLLLAGLFTAAWASRDGGTDVAGGERGTDGVAAVADEPAGADISSTIGSDTAEESGVAESEIGAGSTENAGTVQVEEGSTTTVAPTTTTVPDRDGDGTLDGDDNCPDEQNEDQLDTDDDGRGDACDADDDGDGVPDGDDNCSLVENNAQADVDSDGLGDACDDFPDRDGDGIIDTNDDCVELPEDADTDGDGTPDKCDASPRGMAVVGVSARIDRVIIVNAGDGEADMFGDLTVNGTKFALPEISNMNDIRPGNWVTEQVAVDPGTPLIQVRIWIRDEAGFCLFCKDDLVDITPEPGMEALHLVIDTKTGAVDLATDSWSRLQTVGTLTGSGDGDLSGTIAQLGDDDGGNGVHQGSIATTLTLARQPAP